MVNLGFSPGHVALSVMMSEGWGRSGGTELDVPPAHMRLHSKQTHTYDHVPDR